MVVQNFFSPSPKVSCGVSSCPDRVSVRSTRRNSQFGVRHFSSVQEVCQDFTPELTERSPDFSGPMSRGGSGSSHSEQCGVCSSVSHLFRRIMCIGGASRRGSDESYYYHQHPETRLIEVRVEVVTFLSKHLPVNPLDKI